MSNKNKFKGLRGLFSFVGATNFAIPAKNLLVYLRFPNCITDNPSNIKSLKSNFTFYLNA